jgi:HlyD family secretion protein
MTQNVVTYTVEVLTDNSSGRLLPYLTANLQFEVDKRENVLLVPNEALRWKPQASQVIAEARGAYAKSLQPRETDPSGKGGPGGFDTAGQGVVWVPEGNYVRPVKVRLGLTDGAQTEIVGGDLSEGANVVTGDQRQAAVENVTNPFTPQMFGGKKSQ